MGVAGPWSGLRSAPKPFGQYGASCYSSEAPRMEQPQVRVAE
jgi:hypothetical protein